MTSSALLSNARTHDLQRFDRLADDIVQLFERSLHALEESQDRTSNSLRRRRGGRQGIKY